MALSIKDIERILIKAGVSASDAEKLAKEIQAKQATQTAGDQWTLDVESFTAANEEAQKLIDKAGERLKLNEQSLRMRGEEEDIDKRRLSHGEEVLSQLENQLQYQLRHNELDEEALKDLVAQVKRQEKLNKTLEKRIKLLEESKDWGEDQAMYQFKLWAPVDGKLHHTPEDRENVVKSGGFQRSLDSLGLASDELKKEGAA